MGAGRSALFTPAGTTTSICCVAAAGTCTVMSWYPGAALAGATVAFTGATAALVGATIALSQKYCKSCALTCSDTHRDDA